VAKLQWFKFYPGDWLDDAVLQRCSVSAQGAWMNLICYAFKMPQRGVFRTTRGLLDCGALARIAAQGRRRTVEELVDAGVLNVAKRTGTYFCKRLVRDELRRRREARRKANERDAKAKNRPVVRSLSAPCPENVRGRLRDSETPRGITDACASGASESLRKPDLIWDSTIEHLFPSLNGSNLNGRDRKRVGAIVSDLKARKATPDEIAKRWAECQRRYDRPGVDALVKHWDELGRSKSRGGSDLVRRALDGEFD